MAGSSAGGPPRRPVPAAAAMVPAAAAARASIAGSASSSESTATTRSGAMSASSGPNPTRVSRIWSDQRLVASSMAIADSTAVTMGAGPVTEMSPCAAARSTSTCPVPSVPMVTRPGNSCGSSPASFSPASGSAVAGSRHTWPSPTAVHGAGASRSAGATQRSRFSRLRWAANTVGGACQDRASACDR